AIPTVPPKSLPTPPTARPIIVFGIFHIFPSTSPTILNGLRPWPVLLAPAEPPPPSCAFCPPEESLLLCPSLAGATVVYPMVSFNAVCLYIFSFFFFSEELHPPSLFSSDVQVDDIPVGS